MGHSVYGLSYRVNPIKSMDNTQLWCMIRIQSDRNISWIEYTSYSHNHDATFEEAFFIFSFLYDT